MNCPTDYPLFSDFEQIISASSSSFWDLFFHSRHIWSKYSRNASVSHVEQNADWAVSSAFLRTSLTTFAVWILKKIYKISINFIIVLTCFNPESSFCVPSQAQSHYPHYRQLIADYVVFLFHEDRRPLLAKMSVFLPLCTTPRRCFWHSPHFLPLSSHPREKPPVHPQAVRPPNPFIEGIERHLLYPFLRQLGIHSNASRSIAGRISRLHVKILHVWSLSSCMNVLLLLDIPLA